MQAISNFNVSPLLIRRVVSTTGVFLATCCISLTASGEPPTATTPTPSTTQVPVMTSTQAVTGTTPVAMAFAPSDETSPTPTVPPAPSYLCPCGFSVDSTKPIAIQYTGGRDKNGHFAVTGAVAAGDVKIDGSSACPPIYNEVSVKFTICIPNIPPPIEVTIGNVKWDSKNKQYSIQAKSPAQTDIDAHKLAAKLANSDQMGATHAQGEAAKAKEAADKDVTKKTEEAKTKQDDADAAKRAADKAVAEKQVAEANAAKVAADPNATAAQKAAANSAAIDAAKHSADANLDATNMKFTAEDAAKAVVDASDKAKQAADAKASADKTLQARTAIKHSADANLDATKKKIAAEDAANAIVDASDEAKQAADAKASADKALQARTAIANAPKDKVDADAAPAPSLDKVTEAVWKVINNSPALILYNCLPTTLSAQLTITPSQTATGNGVVPQDCIVQGYLVMTFEQSTK